MKKLQTTTQTSKYKVVLMYGKKRESGYLRAKSIYEAEAIAKAKAKREDARFLSVVVCYERF